MQWLAIHSARKFVQPEHLIDWNETMLQEEMMKNIQLSAPLRVHGPRLRVNRFSHESGQGFLLGIIKNVPPNLAFRMPIQGAIDSVIASLGEVETAAFAFVCECYFICLVISLGDCYLADSHPRSKRRYFNSRNAVWMRFGSSDDLVHHIEALFSHDAQPRIM
eukprot:c20628_g1_i2.p1 GENE.c20628_g1_i2~~c20628_g1_i2.p1  ORF type:complete len:163 (-),score=13.19 c20628_g1_i2:380-868(-)